MKQEDLLNQLKSIFVQEAKERINCIINSLIKIGQTGVSASEKKEIIEVVFRDMHSLKGAARSVDLNNLEGLFQILEDLMTDIKKEVIELTPQIAEIILNAIEQLDEIINEQNFTSQDNSDIFNTIKNTFIKALDNCSLNEYNVQTPEVQEPTAEDINDAIEDSDSSETEIKKDKVTLKTETEIKTEESAVSEPKEPNPIIQSKETKPEEKNETAKNIKTDNLQAQDTVRLASNKLDSLLLKSENLIKIKQMFHESIASISNIYADLENLRRNYIKLQPEIGTVKQEYKTYFENDRRSNKKPLTKIIETFEDFEIKFNSIDSMFKNLLNNEKEYARNSEKMIDSFLYEIKEVAMLPFSNILNIFPRMVKDLAKELNKNIDFHIKGDNNEIDRRILQEIKDPLIHILRNSIDHGVESPDVRKSIGKNEKGLIDLSISINQSGKIEISISDDGKGIDIEKIKSKVIKENYQIDTSTGKDDDELLMNAIFKSGFSTKNIITDISGRGLGLAIVKEKIEKLGGSVKIKSETGKGTEFILELPVALSTFKGVIVKTSNKPFIIPSINIERIVRIKDPKIKPIENRISLVYADTTYPIVNLSEVLNIPHSSSSEDDEDNNIITCIILEKNNKYMALEIDHVLEEKEVLVKDLGSQLLKVKNISGATILNSGEIVPILNIQDLFYSAVNTRNSSRFNKSDNNAPTKQLEKIDRKDYKILLAEDSITSRMLIKNILESSGYNVDAAMDGVAAMTLLKTKEFDLVVSDIEMPRMDGLTLSKKIRSDNKLKDMPIVLLTSLASDEDKERGINAGANAYLVKSNFDQSNLLETIESLI